jgi:hypothetical protein
VNRRQLEKIEDELLQLRASPTGVRASELVRLAGKLGRTGANRGKHPTYVRQPLLPGVPAYPVTIPGHPGDLKPGTAKNIVNSLLSDVDEWKQVLDQQQEQVAGTDHPSD